MAGSVEYNQYTSRKGIHMGYWFGIALYHHRKHLSNAVTILLSEICYFEVLIMWFQPLNQVIVQFKHVVLTF